MLIFWKARLVLLAVPKTGTSALEAALDPLADIAFRNPPGAKHSHLYRFETFLRPALDRVEPVQWQSVAVMRDPIDWLGSWYRYRRRDALLGDPRSTQDISFDAFVAESLSDTPPPRADVGHQGWFLAPPEGGPALTHLFAFERLDKLQRFLENRLSCRLDLDRLNVSPDGDLTLSAGTEARLRERHADDFALYARLMAAGGRL